MKNRFNKTFWEKKYNDNKTGWDIGKISTPLKTYIDQIENKNIHILIPGAGNSYEAEYLFINGFQNVFVVDIAITPLNNFKKRYQEFPKENLIYNDFFELEGLYDLIIEQTFFCALEPNRRSEYTEKTHNLLKDNGKLVGLLFDFRLTKDGPPFGGSDKEYQQLFKKRFLIKTLERCYNSINPRVDRELFFIFTKK